MVGENTFASGALHMISFNSAAGSNESPSKRRLIHNFVAATALLVAGSVMANPDAPLVVPTTSVEAPTTPAEKLMAQRPFAPTDRSLFAYKLYPTNFDGSPMPEMQPAPAVDLTESQARQKLQDYMRIDSPHNPERQAAAMQVFDNPKLVGKIPNHSLRAALAALTGTFAEPAIQMYLSYSVAEVKFDDNESVLKTSDRNVAYTWVEDNGQFTYYFNKKYRGENPFLFTHLLAHEPLHQDTTSNNMEETVATLFETLITLQQLSKHPELLGTTELSRRMVSNAFIRFNSGTGFRLGVFDSNGNVPIAPGSSRTEKSWWERVPKEDVSSTPGNSILGQYLKNIGVQGMGDSPKFSMDVLKAISSAPGPLTSEELLAAARSMKLDVPSAPGSPKP